MDELCVGLDPYYVGMSFKWRAYWDKDGTYVRFWCPELAQLPDSLEIPASVGGSTSKIESLISLGLHQIVSLMKPVFASEKTIQKEYVMIEN